MNKEITQVLADFVETARNDDFNLNITLTKFPELAQVDNQLLADFVETARNDNFDLNVTLPKFPEITGVSQEDKERTGQPGKGQDPTVYYGTPVVGLDKSESPTVSKEEDVSSDPIKKALDEEAKEKDAVKKQAEREVANMSPEKQEELFGANWFMMQEAFKVSTVADLIKSGEYKSELPPETTASVDDVPERGDEGEVGLNYDSPVIDLTDFSTVINKNAADVRLAFDKSGDYPGLRIIETGGVGEAVRFILPDGTEVPIDLYPTKDTGRGIREWLYEGTQLGEAQAASRQRVLDEQMNKLKQVKEWYDKNDSREDIGLFRILGQRDDAFHFSFENTEYDDLDSINRELEVIGYEVKAPIQGRYLIYNKEGEVVYKGDGAQGVQKFFWENLTEGQISALKDSTTEATINATNVYRANRKELYDSVISQDPEELLNWGLNNIVGQKAWQGTVVKEGSISASSLIRNAAEKAGVSDATIDLLLGEEWMGNGARVGTKDGDEAVRFNLRTLLDDKDRYGRDKGTGLSIPFALKNKIPEDEFNILQNLFNADENGYTGIVTEDIIKEEAFRQADEKTATYMSTLSSLDDANGPQFIPLYDGNGNPVLDENGVQKKREFRPEALSATIDELRRGSNYLDDIASQNDNYLNMTGSYKELFDAYGLKGTQIQAESKKELDEVLKQVAEAGLGYEVKDGIITVSGLDEDKVNKYQRLVNDQIYKSREAALQWTEGYDALIGEYKTFASDALDLGVITDKEYNFADNLRADFWGGFNDIGLNISSFFGSEQAMRMKESRQRGSEAREQLGSYDEMIDAGLGWRFSGRTIAQQGANVAVAIGTNIILPGAGSWLVPTMFGLSAGGEKRFQLEQQIDAGEFAQLELSSLENAYKNGLVGKAEYLERKSNLHETIALGDIDRGTLYAAVGTAAIIEGGISYAIGTNPNAKSAIDALRGSVDDIASAITTTSGSRFLQMTGKTLKEIGGEVLEEELIYVGNNLADGYLLGADVKWDQFDDIAVTSLLTSGPMNGPSNAINFIKTNYVTSEARQSYFEGKAELETLKRALTNVDPNDTQTINLYHEKIRNVVRTKIAYADNNMEASAIINGTRGLEQLVRAGSIESNINREAGIKPEDSPQKKKEKLDLYRKKLSSEKQQELDTKLSLIQETRDNITASTDVKFQKEALGENGLIKEHLGDRGLRIADRLARTNPEFNSMSNKDKFIAVHDASKKQFQQSVVNEMKNDSDVKKFVEEKVYGKGGFEGSGRTNRKRKLENSYYEALGSMLTAKRTKARVTYDSQYLNAKDILSQKELSEVQVIEKANIKEIQQYHIDNWEDMGYTSIEQAEKEVRDFVDKDGNPVVDDFGSITIGKNGKPTYLTLNAEKVKEKLSQGKILQGTVFSHEISHVITDMAMNEAEIVELAENLHDSMQRTSQLRRVNALAIGQMTNPTIVEEARLKVKDPSKPYNAQTNPILPMKQQTPLAAEEYVHRVQDLLQDPDNAIALEQARKSGQGLGNLFRSLYGGDFTFNAAGSGLNYVVGYIDAFNKGEISRQAKRKISNNIKSDEEYSEDIKSGKKRSQDVSREKAEASDRVQKLWEKGDVASIIDEFDGINTDDAAIAKRKGQNVERKKSLLESILKPYARVAGFNMEDGKMALMTHPRGFLGLVQEYNAEKGVPIAAWLNKYLPERVKEIIGTIGADGVMTVDIDSPAVVAVTEDNDGVSHEMERKGKGVKLWTRFGSKGNSIHNSIMADVISGDIKVDGKNYKTLGGKRFYEVMDMMGINPVNKAGKPKTGNLDQTDVSNAQRWIQQHISEIRNAIIPQHSTTKMVKNPNTGKLEPRPDKAIGIPQVLLNSELFNKHTRKDNLTGYSFNDGLTDAEILSMFGVTKRGEPNVKLKDDRNIGQRIKALVKLTDMAMTNQSARVAMENRGDHISEILHLADGRSLNLYSQDVDPTGKGIIDMLVGDTIEGFQDEAKLVADIALDVGYNTPKFHQRVAEEGISISVLQYLESINFEKYFAKGDQGLKDPLRSAIGTGKFKPGAEALLGKFFENKIDADDVTANKQLAAGAKSLIKSLPAPLVKALGPQFFGLLGSNRGLNKNKNQDVYDAYEAKTKGVVAQPGIVLLNANTGLMRKIQRILVDPNLNAKQKEARVKELYGKDIAAANENNAIALKQVLKAMSKTTDTNARLGIMRMFEIGSNNTLGIRGLTTLDAIQYTDVSQARYIGTHKKTGKVVHFASNPDAKQKNIYDIDLNTKHPNYAAAESYADRKSIAASLTEKGNRKKNYTDEKIQKHKQKILEDALKFKGEHVTPSANTQRLMVEALLQAWYDGGFDMATASEELTANFAQTLGAKVFSDLQDDALGTTSTADQLRMLAIQNDVNIDEFVDTREGQAFSSYVRSFITNKETLRQVQENISKDKSAKFPELKERLSSILDDSVSDIELQKTATDIRKANNKRSQDTSTKGMTAWDFDDTLATTKSNVIFTKDGETKIVSAEDFATQGADLVAEGWTPDFSEFNKVTGGEPGPMFDKAMERARKYGTEDTYILTARAPEAAPAIKEFLDALGLNIPLENITGLGNSTGEAKARWLLDKHAQGYNDIAFADDAMQNVEAVRKVFDENDIKGKVEQAKKKFSQDVEATFVNQMLSEGQSEIDMQFQSVLEETKGVDRRKVFSAVKARQRGKGKGKFKFFLPPSAEDFKGLMYSFMGKGEVGEKHHAWFKKNLFDPYSKGMIRINSLNQEISNNMRSLKKSIPGIKNKLRDNVGDTNFTNEQAIRVFNWNRNGIEIPGLSRADLNTLVKAVNNDADLKIFADNASDIANKIGVDQNPGVAWLAGSVSSDMNDMLKDSRAALLQEFNSNADAVFSDKNLNKIEAIYGSNFREALEDILYRMKTGSTRPQGQSRIMNNFMNWINGSVGTTMFFNARSAMLQMISNVNFINWHDNNPLKAAKAFANQKQYWGDVAMIFNSDYLKQRRGGLGTDLNAAELLKDLQQGDKPMKTAIAHLLQLGFTPTQIADSFAIATGGATMYRNRVNSYVEQGMNKQEAESKAFEDMREISEETQQSTRPDKISQQQASPLGKLILAFQNTPMQYNRIIKRAAQDWVNGRGDWKQHLSKIAYYGGVQSMIFYGLQTALWSSLFGDDDEEDLEDKQSRVINGMMDSLLRGGGIGGAVVATAKNTIIEFIEQDAKNDDGVFYTDPNHAYTVIEALNLSPPIGIKARKLYSATQTYQFNRDVIDQMSKTDIDNPIYDATFSATEALTNIPLSRLYNKYQNISEAMNSDNETWQRVAMLLGWSRWSFGIQNSDVMSAKQEVKEIKAREAEERREQKKQEKEAERQAANEAVIEQHKEQQQQQRDDGISEDEIQCAAVKRNGERCSNKVLPGETYCTIHQEVPQQANEVQCSHIKSNGKRCKMKTKNKSGKCYYHD